MLWWRRLLAWRKRVFGNLETVVLALHCGPACRLPCLSGVFAEQAWWELLVWRLQFYLDFQAATAVEAVLRKVEGRLAGWQPIVYSKTAARLLKAAWCLLRIATPCAVLRRLTEVAVRPAARCLHGTNLPPSHSSISSVVTLAPLSFFLLFWPFGRNTISLKSELLWVLIVTKYF